jgi:hypothetical protein
MSTPTRAKPPISIRGVGDAWRGLCRGSARLVDLVISVALLPESLMTTARRGRGRPHGRLAPPEATPASALTGRSAFDLPDVVPRRRRSVAFQSAALYFGSLSSNPPSGVRRGRQDVTD